MVVCPQLTSEAAAGDLVVGEVSALLGQRYILGGGGNIQWRHCATYIHMTQAWTCQLSTITKPTFLEGSSKQNNQIGKYPLQG